MKASNKNSKKIIFALIGALLLVISSSTIAFSIGKSGKEADLRRAEAALREKLLDIPPRPLGCDETICDSALVKSSSIYGNALYEALSEVAKSGFTIGGVGDGLMLTRETIPQNPTTGQLVIVPYGDYRHIFGFFVMVADMGSVPPTGGYIPGSVVDVRDYSREFPLSITDIKRKDCDTVSYHEVTAGEGGSSIGPEKLKTFPSTCKQPPAPILPE